MNRVYLDNAATSWPKPPAVYEAVETYLRGGGAPAGRSSYADAVATSERVAATRRALAECLGADDGSRVAFTLNGTDALNIALHGVLRAGDHVITSVAEHNSVLRPLRELRERISIETTLVPCDGRGIVDPDDIAAAIRPRTRLIALTSASNVTGALQPIADVGRKARDGGLLFLIDAAQSIGEIPFSVNETRADLVAFPGHKGLLGPLGTGALWVRPGLETELASFRQGGTGSFSERDEQPDEMPDKLEAGNPNVPGILGLAAGLAYLKQTGIDRIRRDTVRHLERLLEGLREIPEIQVVGPLNAEERVGIVSVRFADANPHEVAMALDSARAIQVRAGLHCAPAMHQALGTLERGGTLRLSLGPFNTLDHIDAAVNALKEIATSAMV